MVENQIGVFYLCQKLHPNNSLIIMIIARTSSR